MKLNLLVERSRSFVTKLFADQLDQQFSFHNNFHTQNVVLAVREIGLFEGLSPTELDLVTVAAWFHDTGYTQGYIGHEQLSANIANHFLTGCGLDPQSIEQVTSCILATKFPQQPKNMMEMVLCDADLYHFSKTDYPNFEASLRKEWKSYLNINYTDLQWDTINFEMLTNHGYFTNYGKAILQPQKEINIERLKLALN